jgi:hypothetical protein
MPSLCSLHLGVVRSHRATEVQALRPSPLALAAGESMKITGASRRSAPPGSQKVGVAEYGDDLCESRPRVVLGRKPDFTVHAVACCSPSIPNLSASPVTCGCALPRGRRHGQRHPRSWRRPSAKPRISAFAHKPLHRCRLRYPLRQHRMASKTGRLAPQQSFQPTECHHPTKRRLTLRST